MLPPDYYSYMQDPTLASFLVFIIKFYLMMFVFILLNTLLMSGFVWSLLFICRALNIPWVDGTTKGFIKRTK